MAAPLAKESRKNVSSLKTNSVNASTEETVSSQLGALNTELLSTLKRLNSLIENRSAWADGIEGCREAAVLLGGMQLTLHTALEAAHQLESGLASARSELDRWNKMYAELAAVEKGLRGEYERLREENASLSSTESELRAELEKKHVALEKQTASLANARLLAQELIRETT